MTELDEGKLRFTFAQHVSVFQYDELSFYRNQFNGIAGGAKAVDFVCVDQDQLYLIEVKDYSQQPRTKPSELTRKIAEKVPGTLLG